MQANKAIRTRLSNRKNINIGILCVSFVLLIYVRLLPIIAIIVVTLVSMITSHLEKRSETQKVFDIDFLYNIESLTALENKGARKCPDWLLYPDLERVIWLNHIITVIWNPYLKVAIENICNGSLEKLVEENKPRLLSNLKYDYLNLGSFAPMISSVKKYDNQNCKKCRRNSKHVKTHLKDACLFIDFKLILANEDSEIVFGTKSTEQIRIQQIRINTTVRIKLCEFTEALPGFSRLEFSLVGHPEIEFSVSVFRLNIAVLPFAKKWFEKFFKKDLVSECTYPKFVPLDLDTDAINILKASGKLSKIDNNIASRGILKIYLKRITIESLNKTSICAYCVIKVQMQKLYQTRYFESKNPKQTLTFNEIVVFYRVEPKHSVQIFLMSENESGVDDILGQSFLNLASFTTNENGDMILDLFEQKSINNTNKSIGKVYIDCTYVEPDPFKKEIYSLEKRQKIPAKKSTFSLKEGVSSIHIVNVAVLKANGFTFLSKNKTPNICVAIEIGKFCARTKMCSNISNPEWNEVFEFELPFLYTKEMIVSVFNINSKFKSRILGYTKIKFLDDDGLILLNENQKTDWYHLNKDENKNVSLENFNGQINLKIETRILNLPTLKKTFSYKKIKDEEESLINQTNTTETIDKQITDITNSNLVIEILKASNLELLSSNDQELNTFVKLQVNDNDVCNTRIIEKCGSPHWCETFQFTLNSYFVKLSLQVINKRLKGGSLDNEKKMKNKKVPNRRCSLSENRDAKYDHLYESGTAADDLKVLSNVEIEIENILEETQTTPRWIYLPKLYSEMNGSIEDEKIRKSKISFKSARKHSDLDNTIENKFTPEILINLYTKIQTIKKSKNKVDKRRKQNERYSFMKMMPSTVTNNRSKRLQSLTYTENKETFSKSMSIREKRLLRKPEIRKINLNVSNDVLWWACKEKNSQVRLPIRECVFLKVKETELKVKLKDKKYTIIGEPVDIEELEAMCKNIKLDFY